MKFEETIKSMASEVTGTVKSAMGEGKFGGLGTTFGRMDHAEYEWWLKEEPEYGWRRGCVIRLER